MAEALGISADYLRHAFAEQFGETVHDFLTRMRVEHAKDLLRNSRLPQKAMAGICGFADIQQFSRRFRQVTGVPPGEYRKGRGRGANTFSFFSSPQRRKDAEKKNTRA